MRARKRAPCPGTAHALLLCLLLLATAARCSVDVGEQHQGEQSCDSALFQGQTETTAPRPVAEADQQPAALKQQSGSHENSTASEQHAWEQQLQEMHAKLAGVGQQLEESRQQAEAAQSSIRTYEQELLALEAALVHMGGMPVGLAARPLHTHPVNMGPTGHAAYGHLNAVHGGAAAESSRVLVKGPKHRSWPDLFLLLAAVQADAQVMSAIPLSTDLVHASTPERAPRFLALGDAKGKVYIFTPRGDLVAEHQTGTESAITSLASYPSTRNESTLLTGHANGEVRMHGVVENLPPRSKKAGAQTPTEEDQSEEDMHSLTASIAKVYEWGILAPNEGTHGRLMESAGAMQHVVEEHGGSAPITLMQTLRLSSRAESKRMVAIWDAAGRLRVQRHNGTIRLQSVTNHTHLAATTHGTLMMSLTATHVSVAQQTMRTPPRTHICKFLNGTRMVAAAFDPARHYRAYAVNDHAQLLTLMVPHDHRTTTCKVLKVRSLPMLQPEASLSTQQLSGSSDCSGNSSSSSSSSSDIDSGAKGGDKSSGIDSKGVDGKGKQMSGVGEGVGGGGSGGANTANVLDGKQDGKEDGLKQGAESVGGECGANQQQQQQQQQQLPVLLTCLKGYLIMSSPRGVTVFNVSSSHYPPQEVITEPASALAGLFGASIEEPPEGSSIANASSSPVHLLATSPAGGVLTVGLGTANKGIVAMFESTMHVPLALSGNKALMTKAAWMQPAIIGVIAVLALLFYKLRSGHAMGMGPMGMGPGGLAARRARDRLDGSSVLGGSRGTGRLSDRGSLGLGGSSRLGAGLPGTDIGGMGMGPGMGGLGMGAGTTTSSMGMARNSDWGRAVLSSANSTIGGLDSLGGMGNMRGAFGGQGFSDPYQGGLGRIPEDEDDDDNYKAYGGYPGPRSARRGLAMNVPPVHQGPPGRIDEEDEEEYEVD